MAKKTYDKMTENELAEARIAFDQQMQALREEKRLIQQEVNRRRVIEREALDKLHRAEYEILNAGNIPSEGKAGGK